MSGMALVCDADFDTRFLCERTFRARGYNVVMAASGIEAVEAIQHHRPEVIVISTDLRWGGFDGVLDVLKAGELQNYCPLILIAGVDSTFSLSDRSGIPESQCLRKPLSARMLQNVLSGAGTTPMMDALQI